MTIIFVLLSTLIMFSCSQLNRGYRWYGGYEPKGYSGKYYVGSKNGWRYMGGNYGYINNGNNNENGNIGSNNGNRNIGSNNGNDNIGSNNGNGNIGRNNGNDYIGINNGNGNLGNDGQWEQWKSWGQCSAICGQGTEQRRRICSDSKCPGLSVDQRQCMGSRRRIQRKWRNTFDYRNSLCYEYDSLIFDGEICKKDPVCRVFVGMFMPKQLVPTTQIKFQICNSQNRCVDAGFMSTYGPSGPEFKVITTRNPNDYYMVEFEVTDTFKNDAIFEGDLTARISFIKDPTVMIRLDPVMIWRYNGGVERGTAYLPPGSRREDYGTLLDKFDKVVENIFG